MKVSCKTRHGRNIYNNLVVLTCLVGPYYTVNNCCTDLIVDGMLLIGSGCDEELILDVDEML